MGTKSAERDRERPAASEGGKARLDKNGHPITEKPPSELEDGLDPRPVQTRVRLG